MTTSAGTGSDATITSGTSAGGWTRSPWVWAGVAICTVTLLVHGGSLGGGMVYDDHRFIEHNEGIRSFEPVAAFTDPASASHGEGIQHDIYRPLRTLLFALQFKLFATVASDGAVEFHLGWWHLVSVLLHALNACLVLRLLRPLMRDAWLPAAGGALLFAIHPVTSESVAWLSSQGDLLAVTLMLVTLILLERRGLARTIAGSVTFACACLAKESALMLPALVVLRDMALPRADDAPWQRASWQRAGALALVAVGYFALRLSVIEGLAQVQHPYGERAASVRGMLHGLVWYAGALFWPSGFSFDARIDIPFRWSDPVVWVGAGLLVSLLAAGLWGLRRRRYLLAFASLGLLVTLGPVSNVIVPLKAFVADRFLYPGLICLAVALAASLRYFGGGVRTAAVTVFVGVLVLFGLLTAGRNAAWADDYKLWDAVRRDRPQNANAYQGVAFEYAGRKEISRAERAYASYLEANPADGKSLRHMGDLFGELAEGLVPIGGVYEEGTNLKLRQKQARVAQLRLYRRALTIWEPEGGLVFGRGSELMRKEMLGKWMEAAVDLGDLRAAKYANDYYIDLEAQGYTHDDADAVMRNARWARRRARILFALRAIQTEREMPRNAKERARIEADRAAVLRDIGLDPNRKRHLAAIEHLIAGLIEEATRHPDLTPDAGLFLHRAALLVGTKRVDAALRVLNDGLRVHPRHPSLEQNLRALRGR